MAVRLIHLLSLLALVLMPLGMATAPVRAAPQSDHAMAMPAAGHCDEQGSGGQADSNRMLQCAIACATILPSSPLLATHVASPAERQACAPAQLSAEVLPNTDPPPPKRG